MKLLFIKESIFELYKSLVERRESSFIYIYVCVYIYIYIFYTFLREEEELPELDLKIKKIKICNNIANIALWVAISRNQRTIILQF